MVSTIANFRLPENQNLLSAGVTITGIAPDANGNVYLSLVYSQHEPTSNLKKISSDGSIGDVSSDFQFGKITGLAIDADENLYLANDDKILKRDRNGGSATIADLSDQRIWSITVDSDGRIYGLRGNPYSVFSVAPDGTVTSLASLVMPISLNLVGKNTLAITALAGVFILNTQNRIPFSYDETARFRKPADIRADGIGNIYVLDSGNKFIRKISPGGAVSTISLPLNLPLGFDVDTAGNVYVDDAGTIRKIDATGSITTIATGLAASGKVWMRTVPGFESLLYLLEPSSSSIRQIAPDGAIKTVFSGAPLSANSRGLAVDIDANTFYVSDGSTIYKLTPSFSTVFATGINQLANDLVLDLSRNLIVSEYVVGVPSSTTCQNDGLCSTFTYGQSIQKVNADGSFTAIMVGPPGGGDYRASAKFGSSFIASAPDGNLYASFLANNTIYKVTPEGNATLFAGKGGVAGSTN